MTFVVLPLALFETTQSTWLTSVLFAIRGVTYLLASLPLGLVADRFSPRTVLFAGDLFRSVAIIVLALATLQTSTGGAMVLFASALIAIGLLTILSDSASASAIVSLVGKAGIERAQVRLGVALGAGEIIGLSAAGVAVAILPYSSVLAINAGTLLVGAILLLIVVPRGHVKSAARKTTLPELLSGLDVIRGSTLLRGLTGLGMLDAFIQGGVFAQLVVLLSARPGNAPEHIGWVYATLSIGALIGSALYRFAARWGSLLNFTSVVAIICCITVVLMGMSVPILVTALLAGIWGVSASMLMLAVTVSRQQRAAIEVQGRAQAAGRMLNFGVALPSGSITFGAIATWIGPAPTFLLIGSLGVVTSLVIWHTTRVLLAHAMPREADAD
ncbi:MFS transporter [Microbacterium profundi]|nr:MFS transporter [Microbacterium profundi]